MHTNFNKHIHLGDAIPIQSLLNEVLNSNSGDEFKKTHPLLIYLSEFKNLNHLLPKHLIGDPERVQQVAINIIQNAIDNTEHGKIDVHVSYDWTKQQIIFIVND